VRHRGDIGGRRGGFGTLVLGIGSAGLGAAGLVWGAFAFAWQAVPPDLPGYVPLAYGAGVLLVAAGAGVAVPRVAAPAALVLAVLYALFAIPWAVRVVRFPQMFGTWGGLAEMVSLVIAALLLASGHRAPTRRAWGWRGLVAGYGVCAVVFGFNHFLSLAQTADMVPGWLPPGRMFWAVATGVFHYAAGVAILAGIQARLAARLLAAMMLVFEALVWLPFVIAAPGVHMMWAGNAITLALAGAALVVADALARDGRDA
jgi:uncharacterized membrane protein YphA (DoxX/SURF4 family)